MNNNLTHLQVNINSPAQLERNRYYKITNNNFVAKIEEFRPKANQPLREFFYTFAENCIGMYNDLGKQMVQYN